MHNCVNSVFISKIHNNSPSNREFNVNSISIWRIHYQISNSIWIHYFSREFIMNSVYDPWLHYLFREFTIITLSNSGIHCEFTIHFANSLWIQFFFREFTIFFATQLWIHFLFRELTLNSLWITRICYKNTSCFAN